MKREIFLERVRKGLKQHLNFKGKLVAMKTGEERGKITPGAERGAAEGPQPFGGAASGTGPAPSSVPSQSGPSCAVGTPLKTQIWAAQSLALHKRRFPSENRWRGVSAWRSMGERRGGGGTRGKWGHWGTRAGGRCPRGGDTRAPHCPGGAGALPPRASVSPCPGHEGLGMVGEEQDRSQDPPWCLCCSYLPHELPGDFALSSFATVLRCQSQGKPRSTSPEPVLSS